MSAHGMLAAGDDGYECLAGGGEMGALMRSLDWSSSSIGPVRAWPQSLRTSVSICLNSRFAILIWWGPDLVMLYNDAYRDIIAGKHPAALGHPGRECWPEIWHIVGPMLEGVLQRGEATWSDDLLLLLDRTGYLEECYFTFSYSPIRDESGGVGGAFTPVAETTDHVIGARRMRTLRDLASHGRGAHDVIGACRAAADTLAENLKSIPFSAIYLFDDARQNATLVAGSGLEAGASFAASHLSLDRIPGVLADAARSSHMTLIENLAELLGPLPSGAWDTPARGGVVLPILMPGQGAPLGFVLAGANPRKRVDAAYRSFFELVGNHICTAVAEARAHEEERRRLRELAELDRAKTVFFSNVSHEFRTPLTLMLGPIEEMLERAHPSAAVSRQELQLVHRNSMRLLKLVDTLLDFSRIEAGRSQAAYEPAELGALTAEIAGAFRSAMDTARLDYVIDCPPLAEPAYVDREMWEKIVLNLVSNAFKFTMEGAIAVRLRDAGDSLELAVEDTGAGIPSNELAHIFDRFHRVEGARGRTHEGSGIGLALVNELVKLHSGSIRVESSPGKGSRFVVSVPKGRVHLPPEHVRSDKVVGSQGVTASVYVDEALHWLPETVRSREDDHLFAEDTVQAPHVQNATGRILLADDNADMRAYVRRLLAGHYDIEAVGNGEEALAAARRQRPDLVLTDVMMPGLDGFGLLRELRADEDTRAVPVILLSARAGEDARVEGLAAGADDYIVKPFTARELLARVGAHLSLSRLRGEAAARERALRAEAEAARQRSAAILASISDGFIALDRDWRFTYVNEEAERSLGRTRNELTGKVYWELFPQTLGTNVETQFRRAMEQGHLVQFENYYEPWRRWFEIRVYPAKDEGVSVFFHDITPRKRAEDAIRESNRALQAANADLERFANSVSHDLREPLRTISIYCELLHREYAGRIDSRADEMIAACMEGARRMSALIDDLLDYARATSGRDEPAETCSLEPALHAVLLNLQAAIAETAASVTHDPLPEIRMGAAHAQLLFQNLVGNALKYRRAEPPKIHVGARREGDWVFSVQDNGIGIAPEHRDSVFVMFKRLHSASRYSGTGLGLTICKKLVERYGGRIWFESEPGVGTTFFFSIPDRAGETSRQAESWAPAEPDGA